MLQNISRLTSAADVSQRSAHSAGLQQISLLAATLSVLAHADADKTIPTFTTISICPVASA